jgi:hypothetical protein
MGGFVRGAVWGLAALLVVAQFIRPARTNPVSVPGHALEDVVSVPPAVEAILTRSCADCHSDRTQWPWYSKVAPVSWFVINHVLEGRRHMNTSEWVRPGVNDPTQYAREKFHSACKQVQTGEMPLSSYLLIHRDARLSPADVEAICSWADSVMARPRDEVSRR